MTTKAIITVGLGFGDESKGSCVDYLTNLHSAPLVIRYNGGHQAAHNVVLPDGRHHTFSQFGSGTFAGAKTYLGPQVIVEPLAMHKEAKNLVTLGINNPFKLLYVDSSCLVSTEFHKALNKIKELNRISPHGSCGRGIGETRNYNLKYGNSSIVWNDLKYDTILKYKLELMRDRVMQEAQEYVNNKESYAILQLMYNTNIKDYANLLNEKVTGIETIDHHTELRNLCENNTIIFEGAQGVLLDEFYGFHPHTTWSTTTSRHALEICENLYIHQDNIQTLGIIRTYLTRHGHGPLPSETNKVLCKNELNGFGAWQGAFRFGYMDKKLMEYSLQIQPVDGIFLTHVDLDPQRIVWNYHNEIVLDSNLSLNYKSNELTPKLLKTLPNEYVDVSAADFLEKSMNLQVYYMSQGPKREHKSSNMLSKMV